MCSLKIMSLPRYCLDIGRSRLKCSCSVPPPTFNVPLPPIPTTESPVKEDGFWTEITTTDGPLTGTSSNSLSDSKLLGLVIGIIFLIVMLIVCLFCIRRKRGPVEELAQGADRSKLKLSPSSCSQKPLLQSSSAPSENPVHHNPQQPNGESEKMMEISENMANVDTINDKSFTGGDLNIPMIDDEEEEDIDPELVSRLMFRDHNIPKIDDDDDDEEEDIDPELVSRVIFNESTC